VPIACTVMSGMCVAEIEGGIAAMGAKAKANKIQLDDMVTRLPGCSCASVQAESVCACRQEVPSALLMEAFLDRSSAPLS
jgi:hypothetical protein